MLQCSIITARKRSCGKVMFLQVSAILFTEGGAGGAWSQGAAPGGECLVLVGVCSGRRIAWSGGCLVQGGAWSRGMCLVLGGVCSRVVPGGDPPESYCCGRYASYWNAFLLFHIFLILEKSNHSFSS